MSRGNRTIPEATRGKVIGYLSEGYSYAAAARLTGVSSETAKSIWQDVHPLEAPPSAYSHPSPLKVVRSYVRGRVRIIDYECPHCGALIHHAVIDFQEKPWRCPYCGKEVE